MKTIEKAIRILVRGNEYRLETFAFSSSHNLHRHYFKHVARINQVDRSESKDPECWHELLSEQTELPKDLDSRRKQAKKRLRSVKPRCILASKAPTADDVCTVCKLRGAGGGLLQAVNQEFKEDFGVYEACALAQVVKALEANEDSIGGALLVDELTGPTLHALTEDRVFIVAGITRSGLRGVTAFRPTFAGKMMSFVDLEKFFAEKRRSAMVRMKILPFEVLDDEKSGVSHD